MNSLWQDIRYAVRQYLRSPGFAAVAVISLALGIGASTSVFSVIRALLLEPYPYKDADRMVHVEMQTAESDRHPLIEMTQAELQEVRQMKSVDDVFWMQNHSEALTGDQLPVSVEVGLYSPNLFTYMGVPPLMGREFTLADARNGNPEPVAVLSYLFWKKQYGAAPDVVGKRIELDHTPYTIIGVLPQRFTWGNHEIYRIAPYSSDSHDYGLAFFKLKPGVSHDQFAAELKPYVDRFAQADPHNFPQKTHIVITTLNEEVLGRFRPALMLLFAAVFLLLLIGCANVSILLSARGTMRQHELAVRTSVGAARERIIRQLLTESLLLSIAGAALGVAMAYFGVSLLVAHLPQDSFPREAIGAIRVNGLVLLFAVSLALLTGIIFGVSPALQLSRPEFVQGGMQSNSVKVLGNPRARHTHRVLIAGQVALTMLLLACAGAAIRSFLSVYNTPLGYDPKNVFYLALGVPKDAATTWQARVNLQETIRQAAERAPGVSMVSSSTTWQPPFSGVRGPIEISSKPDLTDAQAQLMLAGPQIFSVLRVPLMQGRIFTPTENAHAVHVALVNRTFVHQFFGGESPIGKSVRSSRLKLQFPGLVTAEKPDDWFQIIGVVGDVKNDALDRPVQPAIFLPSTIALAPDVFLVGRSSVDPESALHSVGLELHKLNPEIYARFQHPATWVLDTWFWATQQFVAWLFGVFAALALALAATGLYSVVSYSVSQRTQELGIRMALGAQRLNVVQLVLRSALLTVAAGTGIGVAVSVTLNRLINGLLQGNSQNPVTLVSVATLLLAIAAIASVVPAIRAASINPMQALRTE